MTSKLTLNLGLRWDVYPPWVEIDDRQSNFDETTGKFVVASDDAVIDGVEGRPLPADLLEEGLRSALRLRLRPRRQRQDAGARRLRHLLELHARRHLVVEGAEPAVPAVDVADADADRVRRATCCSRTACRRRRASIRTGPPPGSTRSIFDINFRDAYARQWNLNVQRALRPQLHGRGRLRRLAGPADARSRAIRTRRRRSSASPTRTSTVPYAAVAPALRSIGQVQSMGTLDYNALLVKFQRRFANNFSFLNSYTYGKAIDLNSDNDGEVTLTNVYDPQYNRGPADYDITHTFTSSWIYELPWARDKLYGGWQMSGILLRRGGLPLTITQTQGVLSTGTGNRPNRICDGKHRQPDDRPLVRPVAASCRRPTRPAPTATPAAASSADRGRSTSTCRSSRTRRFGRVQTEFRIEAFNLLNHPQFAQPEHDVRQRRRAARSRRCCRARRARSAARPSGRCSSASRSGSKPRISRNTRNGVPFVSSPARVIRGPRRSSLTFTQHSTFSIQHCPMAEIDRRAFLAGLSVASGLTIVPRRVLGGRGYVARAT